MNESRGTVGRLFSWFDVVLYIVALLLAIPLAVRYAGYLSRALEDICFP